MSRPLSIWDIGGCNCPARCSVNFLVRGCQVIAAPGATVNVYTALGGTLLASGTTDSTGHVTLSWSGASGSYYVTSDGGSTRFAAYGQTLSLTCGGNTTISMSPASGYCCAAACVLPVKSACNCTVSGTQSSSGTTTCSGSQLSYSWASGGVNYQYLIGPSGAQLYINGSSSGSSLPRTSLTCPPGYTATYSDGTNTVSVSE